MRRLALSSLLLLALAPLVSCGGKRNETVTAESFRLPNGLQVDLVSGPCGDKVALALLFTVGIDHDPPQRSGMALVLGRLLAGGARIVDTGNDHSMVSMTVDRAGLLDELDAVAARMRGSELGEEALGRARTQVLEDLAKMRGGDPTLTAKAFAAEAVQPTRGNGWRGGIATEIESITLAETQAFWQAHLTPGNARLVVVGRLDAKKVKAHLETAFAGLPAGTPAARRNPADSTVTGTLVIGDKATGAAVAVPAPSQSDPAYPAFLILAARLMDAAQPGGALAIEYDPLSRPETLFATGTVQQGDMQPEAAAGRIRSAMAGVLERPLAPADVAAARARFGQFLGVTLQAAQLAACKQDPRGMAVARARRAQLEDDGAAVAAALAATTPRQLAEAARLFEPKRTAAVIAGGTIR